jgi:hypothetical protein
VALCYDHKTVSDTKLKINLNNSELHICETVTASQQDTTAADVLFNNLLAIPTEIQSTIQNASKTNFNKRFKFTFLNYLLLDEEFI